MITYKLNNIRKQLSQHLEDIQAFEFSSTTQGTNRYSSEESKAFFTSISDFVHYATRIQEIVGILQNILDSHHALFESGKVKTANQKFSEAFNQLASSIKKLPKWTEFCITEKGRHTYINPFEASGKIDRYNMLSSRDFVDCLETFRSYNGDTIQQVETVKEILVDTMYSLNGILDKYFEFDKPSYNQISKDISDTFGQVNENIWKLILGPTILN